MDPSKPPSDISVPSKANSDIEERPKASSDIGVTTLGSKLSNSIDFTNPDSSKVELELKGSKCDIEPRHRSGSINVKLSSTEPGYPAPVEDAPVDSRLPRKRGKLVHSCSSINDNFPCYSFVSKNSFENGRDGTDFVEQRTSLFDPEKLKLQAKIQECKVECRNGEVPIDFNNSFLRNSSVRYKVNSLESENNCSSSRFELQKSQSFACSNMVTPKTRQWAKMRYLPDSQGISNQSSFKSQSRLVKMQTVVNLDDIGTDIEDISKRSILEDKSIPMKLHVDNYICGDRCQAKALKHSSSFQVGYKLRETKIVSAFEKPKLSSSRSFCSKNKVCESIGSRQPRLGNVSTTKCYNGSISSSLDEDIFEGSMIDNRRSNLSPPPLSNLQIFAISTKPLDIPVTTIDSVPSDVDKLPSLPIIQHSECRLESEKKLSILEPPPPGLVSREESIENWNRFLIQLNSILETRAGEFV